MTAASTTFATINSRRLSRLSATAPANGPSVTPGSAWAAAASAVAKEDPVCSCTKYGRATNCTCVPVNDTSPPDQSQRNPGTVSGDTGGREPVTRSVAVTPAGSTLL